MRGPAVRLVEFERDAVDAVWCHDRAYDQEWSEAWETADHMQLYNPRDIAGDLYGLPLPYDGAWVARRFDGDWWYRADTHARWNGKVPGLLAAPLLVAWALSLRGAELVPWVGRDDTGWPHPRGYYGLIAPVRECALVAGGELRWIVQTATPHGRYALVFDSLERGEDGEPHPTGLWRLV